MIFPRNSIGSPAMIGASGTAISFSFGGVLVNRTGRDGGAMEICATGAMGAAVTTARGAGAGGAAGASIFRKMPRNRPAKLDLTMFDMTLFSDLAGRTGDRQEIFKQNSSHGH